MRPDTHLDPGCPWYALSELRTPNVDWCEAQRCAWIVEPANTWSNLAYLAVAIALFAAARRSRVAELRAFAPAAAAVGVASFVYHASYTFVFQVLDFAGMYVFGYLLLSLNLVRLGALSRARWRLRWVQLVLATTLATVGLDFAGLPIQGIVVVLIAAIIATELRVRGAPDRPRPDRRAFALGIALLAAGSVFSALDLTRTWCIPSHPFLQGHAIWHVLSALSLAAVFVHYHRNGMSGIATMRA